ncbi:hypothetical protein QUF76_01950 [Desulfobacterales bacterium HSG16]|nr:hypothetical protein [Desulfobacterales bacterium HSG16]
MKWIKMIKLRTGSDGFEDITDMISSTVKKRSDTDKSYSDMPKYVNIYRHAALNDFGLTHHSVWIENTETYLSNISQKG